ncbi:extracellular solute-binding protein [Paenibacillus sp. PK4536]|uniref:DUF3502 domain-containing protein n=1 Tax=unclassified Paenibacillus TaxID=185978 RepID=UPI0010C05D76|nr:MULTISPECIES: DUF3502 domain-containing protein [unclassified Paenibacillus]TKJ88344.1 ABC transporter substrate-binding protein [Paenibacillus sp. CFBP13512]WIM40839.1 extracellular solute-binding protein [Paenibacillus sp. PK4536]
MSRFRKLTISILIAVMVISLAACGGKKESSSAGGDTSQFVTISFVVLGDKPKNGQFEKVMEKVNAIMKEKINAELQWKWVEWADWQTKYNLLLASGEPVDLVTIGTDWLDTWSNAQRGAFLPLDDLLPKYAPKTWKEIPQEDWAQSKYDGKIVLIPENDYTQWINHGFFYRGDWAKQAGITEPIKDWNTIGKYLQWIKDNKPDVIPYDVQASTSNFGGWVQSYTPHLELPISTGYMPIFNTESYDDRYKVVSPVFEDTFLDFAKLMKDWADKGYWREDVLNNKNDARNALRAGQNGMDSHHTQTFSGLRVQMDKDQPGSELMMYPFSRTSNNLLEMPITHGGVSLGAHSKNPERALMAYDLIRNDKEVYQLINYGMEGVQYDIKDGKRVLPANYNETNDSFYSDFWAGRMDKFEIPSDTTWDKIGTMYDEYDKIKKPYPYGQFVFDKTAIESELTAISQVTGEMGPAISYGKAGDPAQAVQEYRDKLKLAGYDKVIAELQRQLDAYKAQMDSAGTK